MKAPEQYFPVVLFIVLYTELAIKTVLPLKKSFQLVVVLVPYIIFKIFIRQEFWKTFGVKDYLLNQNNNFCLNTLNHFPHTLFFPNRANHDLLPCLWRVGKNNAVKLDLIVEYLSYTTKLFSTNILNWLFLFLENQFFNP